MESNREWKRKNDKHSEEDERRPKKTSKRARTKSKSPSDNRVRDVRRKRRHSRSRSPENLAKQDRQTKSTNEPDIKKEAPTRHAKETDMLNTRTGGAYIPPARLRMMQAQITDKSSIAYQRLAWEALKKSIHGHINKINVGNIGIIIKELLKENIVRGRGLLCRSVIQAQAASPTFTNVYAALVAAVNSRFPNIGELLLKRLVIQFKRGFKRNDKSICISSASFIAHLVNQRVAHEILALELLTLLVETPTDDSVEVAIAFLKECGQKLTEVSSKGVNAIFEMLRNILHEGQLDKRVQYMIEVMFQVWKDGFKDHPALIEELELVPEEEQFTHLMMLDEATDPQDILNVFKFDEKYEENEQKYKTLSKEILGSDAESGEEGSSGESGSDEEDDDDEQEPKEVTIIDNTETNLVALRRTIYLTINSSLDFEECAHKLMKMQLKPGQEVELCHMFLDCCAEQRTYEKFYGLLAQRFCNINRIYIGPFEEIFKDSYSTAHRLDTNRLRNVSKFFAHLLFTDSISWEVLECVKLNEEDTTSSSRIYIKILFQELAEYMGLKKLNDRLKDPTLQDAFSGLFPRDNPKNTRFSINFFTSIGLGGLTDELREHLKQMPKNIPPPTAEIKVDSGSSSDDSSDSSSSSDTSSDSSSSEDEEEKSRKKKSSKKRKSKDKEQETLAEQVAKDKNDRWGHDGFYETYGQDARRTDSRDNRQHRDLFSRSRPSKRDMDSDNRRGVTKDDQEQNDDSYKRHRNKDDFRQEEKRSQNYEDRNRNDDRNDRGRGRKENYDRLQQKDERNRRVDERDDKNSEKSRRNNDKSYRNGDKDRRVDDRRHNDDEKYYREEDRSRKTDDKSYYNEKNHNRFHNNTEKEIKDSQRRDKDNKEQLKEDRSNRFPEKYQTDNDRYRDENKRRDDREQRDDRNRREDVRSRRGDGMSHVGDRSDRVEQRERRYDDRTRNDENKDYEEDIIQESDSRQRKDVKNNKTFDKSERNSNNKKYRDDKKRRDSVSEENVSEKEAHNTRYYSDKNAHQKSKEYVTKKAKKQKKKKDKKTRKTKEHKRYNESDSNDDSDTDNNDKNKEKYVKASEDSDTDSSSSSSKQNEGPSRYWDNFDIKGKSESIGHQNIATRETRDRGRARVS